MKLNLLFAVFAGLPCMVSSAAVVVSYDAGITATAGSSGAADPASQGWTFTGGAGNQFAAGYDSGDGGWRTVDGTTSAPSNYSRNLSGAGLTAMTTDPHWTMTWMVALDEDAIGSGIADSRPAQGRGQG